MAYDIFPLNVLVPTSTRWWLSQASRSTQSVGGLSGFTSKGNGGRWMCTMSIPLITHSGVSGAQRIHLARSLIAGFDGGAGLILVPCREKAFAPYPTAPLDPSPFSDGATFSDTAMFGGDAISVTLAADAAEQATTVQLAASVIGEVIGGERYAHEHETESWRMYEIIRFLDTTDGVLTVKVRPPYREATDAGAPANFDRPMVLMRCLNCEDALGALEASNISTLNLTFQEAYDDAV